MLVDSRLGLLDPRADQTEQRTADDNGQREPDEGKSQSLKVSHGMVPFSDRPAIDSSIT